MTTEQQKEWNRASYRRHWAKTKARQKIYNQPPERRAAIRLSALRSIARYPKRYKARYTLRNAVRLGKVIRQPCEACGDPKSGGHHDDYNKPLEVRWLCPRHHFEAEGKWVDKDNPANIRVWRTIMRCESSNGVMMFVLACGHELRRKVSQGIPKLGMALCRQCQETEMAKLEGK